MNDEAIFWKKSFMLRPTWAQNADICKDILPVSPLFIGEMLEVERLTFSVLWEMTPEAEVVDTKYCKAGRFRVGSLGLV